MTTHREQSQKTFQITLLTGDCPNAGSNGHPICVQLFGSDESHSEVFVLKGDPVKDFQRGQKSQFTIQTNELEGDLSMIRIGPHSSFFETCSPSNSGWFLSTIDIVETTITERKNYFFPCNKWIGGFREQKQYEERITTEDLYPSKESDVITVFVLEAKALPTLEKNDWRSNPFVIVRYGTQSHHTAVQEMTINPVFTGYPARFQREVEVSNFQVEIFHLDTETLQTTLISKFYVDLPEENQIRENWFNIQVIKTLSDKSSRKRKRSNSWPWNYFSNDDQKTEGFELVPEKETFLDTVYRYRSNFGTPAAHIRVYNGIAMESPLVDYSVNTVNSQTVHQFQTGDVIAFSGRTLLANMIKYCTDSPYSHLGIVVRMNDPFTNQEELFIAESTHNSWQVEDYFEKVPRKGVTVFKLEERMKRIDAMTAWHLPLRNPLDSEEKSKLIDLIMRLHNGKIRYDIRQLIEFSLPFRENKEDLKELFCSEFVALCLRTVGRLPDDANPSALTPGDVVNADCFKTRGPNIDCNLLRIQIENPPDIATFSSMCFQIVQKWTYFKFKCRNINIEEELTNPSKVAMMMAGLYCVSYCL